MNTFEMRVVQTVFDLANSSFDNVTRKLLVMAAHEPAVFLKYFSPSNDEYFNGFRIPYTTVVKIKGAIRERAGKISLIKQVKDETGMGLKDAKLYVEKLAVEEGMPTSWSPAPPF